MERENATKKRIREVALKLFKEKSFDLVTLSEICEKSKVNKHTFYYYFKSKDDLLDQYYDIPYKIKTCDLSDILTADSFVEQFWLLNQHILNFVEHSGAGIVRQILIKNLSGDIETFQISEEKKEHLRLQKSVVEKGQASGQFRSTTDAKFLVMLFFQLIISASVVWSIHKSLFSFNDYMRYTYEMVFDVDPKYRKMQNFSIDHMEF